MDFNSPGSVIEVPRIWATAYLNPEIFTGQIYKYTQHKSKSILSTLQIGKADET